MPGPIPRNIREAANKLRKEAVRFHDWLLMQGRHTKGAGHAVITVMGKHESAHRVI